MQCRFLLCNSVQLIDWTAKSFAPTSLKSPVSPTLVTVDAAGGANKSCAFVPSSYVAPFFDDFSADGSPEAQERPAAKAFFEWIQEFGWLVTE
jgi:hypothetical protein